MGSTNILREKKDFDRKFSGIIDNIPLNKILIITGAGFDIEMYEKSYTWIELLSKINKSYDESIIGDLVESGVNPIFMSSNRNNDKSRNQNIKDLLKSRKIKEKHWPIHKYILETSLNFLTVNFENINRNKFREYSLDLAFDTYANYMHNHKYFNMHGDVNHDIEKGLVLNNREYFELYLNKPEQNIEKKQNFFMNTKDIKAIFFLGISLRDFTFFQTIHKIFRDCKNKYFFTFDFNTYDERLKAVQEFISESLKIEVIPFDKNSINIFKLIHWTILMLKNKEKQDITANKLKEEIDLNNIDDSLRKISEIYSVSPEIFVQAIDISNVSKINFDFSNFYIKVKLLEKIIIEGKETLKIVKNYIETIRTSNLGTLNTKHSIDLVQKYQNNVPEIFELLFNYDTKEVDSKLLNLNFWKFYQNMYSIMQQEYPIIIIKNKKDFTNLFNGWASSDYGLTTKLLNMHNSREWVFEALRNNFDVGYQKKEDHQKECKKIFKNASTKNDLAKWWAHVILDKNWLDQKPSKFTSTIDTNDKMQYFKWCFEEIDDKLMKDNIDVSYDSVSEEKMPMIYFFIKKDKNGLLKYLKKNEKKLGWKINSTLLCKTIDEIFSMRKDIFINSRLFHNSRTMGDGKYNWKEITVEKLFTEDSWEIRSAYIAYEKGDLKGLNNEVIDYFEQITMGNYAYIRQEMVKHSAEFKFFFFELWETKIYSNMNNNNVQKVKIFKEISKMFSYFNEALTSSTILSEGNLSFFQLIAKRNTTGKFIFDSKQILCFIDSVKNDYTKQSWHLKILHFKSNDSKYCIEMIENIFKSKNKWDLLHKMLSYNNIHNFNHSIRKCVTKNFMEYWTNDHADANTITYNTMWYIYLIIKKEGNNALINYSKNLDNALFATIILKYWIDNKSDIKYEDIHPKKFYLQYIWEKKYKKISVRNMRKILLDSRSDSILWAAELLLEKEYKELNSDSEFSIAMAEKFKDSPMVFGARWNDINFVNLLRKIDKKIKISST